jgi:predicted transglutaminase-like cysteine proteinase
MVAARRAQVTACVVELPWMSCPATLTARRARRAHRACAEAWTRHAVGLLRLLVAGLVVWAGLLSGFGRAWDGESLQRAAERHGPRAVEGARALQQLAATLQGRGEGERLVAVNDFFNRRIAFADDRDTWGAVDHWASPLELLALGRGDCEDYAIAKYFTLAAMGVPVSRLRLVYVRAQVGGAVQPHMVLAYYASPEADPLVLDNLVGDVRRASQRLDLVPVFSFNGEGLWNGTGPQPAGDPVARLSRWRDVIVKARTEGFR